MAFPACWAHGEMGDELSEAPHCPPCPSPAGTDGRTDGLGWAGLGAASQQRAAPGGLTLVFRLHSHLSLLLVSGTQGREVSILIFISGIGSCLLCRCLARPPSLPPHPVCVRPVPSRPSCQCRGAAAPRAGQGCPPCMPALSRHRRGRLLASSCSVPCAATAGTGWPRGGRAEKRGPAARSQLPLAL